MYFNSGAIASIVTILFAIFFAALMRRGNKMADGQKMPEMDMNNIVEIVKFWIKLARLNSKRFKLEERILQFVTGICGAITAGSLIQLPPKFALVPGTLLLFSGVAIKLLKRAECYYSAHKTMWALQLEFDDFRLESGKYSCSYVDAQKTAAQGVSHEQYKLGALREEFSKIQRADMAQWEAIARPSGAPTTATPPITK